MIAEYLLKNSALTKCLMKMNAKLKKLAMTLTITAILLSFTLTNMKIAFSNGTGGKIDLFTQKEPYSGKGLNMPSDAFGPGEVVILYALVTYSGIPLQNLLATFYVQSPDDTLIILVKKTNASGIATINFTIPQKRVNVSAVFGEWFALANVLIGDDLFQDTLTFKVNYIVKIVSVRTIDENLTYRTNFGIGGDVGVEITLRSIAMVMKSATLAIVIQDELKVPVSFYEIRDFKVQPNEKLVLLYCKLYIPKWACVGNATVFVSALTAPVNESGVPYCPGASTEFFILAYEPLTITFHDVAVVEVTPSTESAEVGQPVNVGAVIQNEGTEIESFNVSAYYDDVLIETLQTTLAPHSHATLNFTFETSTVNPGNYTITVSIPHLANEADLTDNVFVDGVVEIKPKPPIIIHDIAIVDVKISNNSLYIGDLLRINVSVVNKGTETETFNLRTYYDSSLIETLQVNALAPNAQVTLTFVWNTSYVHEGFYKINAYAPLPDDINVSDNAFFDGVVEVKAKPPPPPPTHLLTITSSPISGVNFTVNGMTATTPYSATHGEGVYTIAFPHEWTDPPTGRRYIFSHWENGSTNPTRTINLVSDMGLTAYYEEVVEYILTINTTIGGTTNPSPGSYSYPKGTSVTVTAIPDAGYEFDHWTLDGVIRTENPITIVMNRDYTLTAYFKAVPKGWFVPYWFYWLLLLLLILIIILLIIWLYRRKRGKEAEEAFYSGWTAWYYCYDLRNRLYKI